MLPYIHVILPPLDIHVSHAATPLMVRVIVDPMQSLTQWGDCLTVCKSKGRSTWKSPGQLSPLAAVAAALAAAVATALGASRGAKAAGAVALGGLGVVVAEASPQCR